ncbi:MAG: hypothetical protein ACTSSE_16135 [Candidatus Thorarchaeota archaeon]
MSELIPAMPLLMSDNWSTVKFRDVENKNLAINTTATHKQIHDINIDRWLSPISAGYILKK